MTYARCAVLLKREQPGGLNQVTLAHILDVAPMTLVRLLDRLETASLVSRLPDPHDRRAYLLTPTAKARPLSRASMISSERSGVRPGLGCPIPKSTNCTRCSVGYGQIA
jgi:DNA-binding MarR family transcriptional regulator